MTCEFATVRKKPSCRPQLSTHKPWKNVQLSEINRNLVVGVIVQAKNISFRVREGKIHFDVHDFLHRRSFKSRCRLSPVLFYSVQRRNGEIYLNTKLELSNEL